MIFEFLHEFRLSGNRRFYEVSGENELLYTFLIEGRYKSVRKA
jgi:hypothetical protein